MKGSGKITKRMDMEEWFMLVEITTKDSGKKIKDKEEESM